MRIIWHGNAPFAPSGYGEQAGLFIPRLQALGHEIAVFNNYGIQGKTMTIGGIKHYPADGSWGNRNLSAVCRDFGADLVVTLQDAWTQNPGVWDDDTPPVALWAPLDHYPIPPAVLAVLQHERVRPIAMSRFGEEWMTKFGLDPLYVPHGIDTSLFRPQPELRDRVRDQMEIPRDAFLVGMVAANKSPGDQDRKSFAKSFQAFASFAKDHEDAWMFAHTEARPHGSAGIDLDALATIVGIPSGRLRFPPDDGWKIGMPHALVAALYQAFDVLLSPSRGEGFGIPILEAQACGVPVITSNHSAMTELTHAGWMVDGDPFWDELQKSFFYDPFIASIRGALEQAYDARDDRELRQKATAFAQAYDVDVVTETYWKPALDELTRPREVAPLAVNGNRQQRRAKQKKAKAA